MVDRCGYSCSFFLPGLIFNRYGCGVGSLMLIEYPAMYYLCLFKVRSHWQQANHAIPSSLFPCNALQCLGVLSQLCILTSTGFFWSICSTLRSLRYLWSSPYLIFAAYFHYLTLLITKENSWPQVRVGTWETPGNHCTNLLVPSSYHSWIRFSTPLWGTDHPKKFVL